MPLGQNLKLRSALQGFSITGAGAYLVGGSAGRIRAYTEATFTVAILLRVVDLASTQFLMSWRSAANVGVDVQLAGSAAYVQFCNGSVDNASVALTAADANKDLLLVGTNYSAALRQATVNGRRVSTNTTSHAASTATTGIPTIGVRNPSFGVSSPLLSPAGIYDIAISYEVALAAADQQAFFEQTVEEGGIPSSLNGTRWSHFMHAEDYSGDVSRGQVQLGDRAGGVNWKLPVAANGSPTTLILSPLRPLVFGPTG